MSRSHSPHPRFSARKQPNSRSCRAKACETDRKAPNDPTAQSGFLAARRTHSGRSQLGLNVRNVYRGRHEHH